jgi:hypothetical protein
MDAAELDGSPLVLPTAEDIPGVPNEFASAYTAYVTTCEAVTVLEGELDSRATEKAVDIRQQAADLEARIDYPKVVVQALERNSGPSGATGGHIIENKAMYELAKVIGVRQLLDRGQPVTYNELRLAQTTIANFEQRSVQDGLLVAEGIAPAPQLTANELYTATQADEIISHIYDADSIRAKYKAFGVDYNKHRALTERSGAVIRTADIIRHASVPSKEAGVIEALRMRGLALNSDLQAALSNLLAQQLSELPPLEYAPRGSEAYSELVDRARALSPVEALARMELAGMEDGELPFAYSGARIRQLLLKNVPPIALDWVVRVEFRSFTPEEDPADDKLGEHVTVDDLGRGKVIISDSKVRENYEYYKQIFEEAGVPEAARRAAERAQDRMEQTIVHEFSHGLVKVLPTAVLAEWDEARAADPTNITTYVQSCHEEGAYGLRPEDFCDSAALFALQADALSTVSSKRYEAMAKIYEEFMPLYGDVLKPSQDIKIKVAQEFHEEKDRTPEQVRQFYLPHESK